MRKPYRSHLQRSILELAAAIDAAIELLPQVVKREYGRNAKRSDYTWEETRLWYWGRESNAEHEFSQAVADILVDLHLMAEAQAKLMTATFERDRDQAPDLSLPRTRRSGQ